MHYSNEKYEDLISCNRRENQSTSMGERFEPVRFNIEQIVRPVLMFWKKVFGTNLFAHGLGRNSKNSYKERAQHSTTDSPEKLQIARIALWSFYLWKSSQEGLVYLWHPLFCPSTWHQGREILTFRKSFHRSNCLDSNSAVTRRTKLTALKMVLQCPCSLIKLSFDAINFQAVYIEMNQIHSWPRANIVRPVQKRFQLNFPNLLKSCAQ